MTRDSYVIAINRNDDSEYWVLKTVALFLSFKIFLSAGDSHEWRACRDIMGLHTISASNDNNSAKFSKFFTFHERLCSLAVPSRSCPVQKFFPSLWFSSQSLSIFKPLTWGIACKQTFRKSENALSPSASLDCILGHFDNVSLKVFWMTKDHLHTFLKIKVYQ